MGNPINFIQNEEDVNFNSVFSLNSNIVKFKENYTAFNFDEEKLELLDDCLYDNLWYKYFQNEFALDTWIDFENKIEYVLKNLFAAVMELKTNLFSDGSIKGNYLNVSTNYLKNKIDTIELLKSFGIITSANDATMLLNTDYIINKYHHSIDFDIDKIAKVLLENLTNFRLIFNYYFEIFVFPLLDNFKNRNEENGFSRITHHFTFNYTPTFEKFVKSNCVTKFLHGKIDSSTNQIVLGINEIPDKTFDRKHFIPFTKYFQKLNEGTDYVFMNSFEKKLSQNFMFYFLGHSLDRSDKDYINEVFDFANNLKSEIKRIVVIFHDKQSYSQLLINLIDIRGKDDIQNLMKIKNLIFVQSGSEELMTELNRDIAKSGPKVRF